MDREDAKRIIKALSETTFICGANFIETEEYFITKKEVRENDQRKSD